MKQKNETAILVLSLSITIGILGGGYWWFTHQSDSGLSKSSPTPTPTTTISSKEQLPAPTSPTATETFSEPTAVASGTIVRIDGSTSMVRINLALKQSFENRYSGTTVVAATNGSNRGIQDLLAGKVDIAAISRPLTPQEQAQGLVAIPVAKDAIALVVGANSLLPPGTSLKQDGVIGIFRGTISDWSAVGGKPGTIRVINRPDNSGTHAAFRELVLRGENFGTTPNITSWQKDETTAILRALNANGISYATYSQVRDQKTVRIVPIDNMTPRNEKYPYQRSLYYVYKNPANQAVKDFLGYTSSPNGQLVIDSAQ